MRFERTDSFKADYNRLPPSHRAMFHDIVVEFSEACDHYIADNTPFPARFRVSGVKGAPGVLEMTWSFSGPDGRATWRWTTISIQGEDVPAVLWRRIGNHEVFTNP